MKIAIDIDDVVFEFVESYMKFLENKGIKRIPYEKIYTYNFSDILGFSMEFILKTINEYHSSNYFKKVRFINGAKEGVCFLRDNHDIYFVTARVKEVSKKTREAIFDKFHILGNKVVFSGNSFREGLSKCKICKDMGIGLIIEDSDTDSLKYAKNGLKVLLLDKPWNQGIEHERIFRCKDWGEILVKIEEMKNE